MLAAPVEPIRFPGMIRYWDLVRASGLAVVDVPAEHLPALGGLKQQRVRGTLGGVEFTSNVMPAGSGRLALSVSKAMISVSGHNVGDIADVEISSVGRD